MPVNVGKHFKFSRIEEDVLSGIRDDHQLNESIQPPKNVQIVLWQTHVWLSVNASVCQVSQMPIEYSLMLLSLTSIKNP